MLKTLNFHRLSRCLVKIPIDKVQVKNVAAKSGPGGSNVNGK